MKSRLGRESKASRMQSASFAESPSNGLLRRPTRNWRVYADIPRGYTESMCGSSGRETNTMPGRKGYVPPMLL